MSRWILLDELHVQLLIRRDAPAESQDAARGVVASRLFERRLRRVTRRLVARSPDLAEVGVRVSR